MTTTGGLTLTTTVRVVDRVHRDTADGRADALPALAAGLAPVDVRLLGVADLADRGAAARVDVADLARGQTQLRVGAVLGDETLRLIAQELVKAVRNSITIDWTVRENVRAQMRVIIKRILRKYGYPPDKQAHATELVLEQAEVLCRDWTEKE